jgi:hypothetical protein
MRYIVVKGLREIATGNNLMDLIAKIAKSEEGRHRVGTSDVVIWDTGTVRFPTMSIAASTCRGWLTINVPGRKYMTEKFGVSLTPREMVVLRQFFDVWKLEGGQSVSDAILNIYEQTYVKDFKPGPEQIRLDREEFKVFVNKLLSVVRSVPIEKCFD